MAASRAYVLRRLWAAACLCLAALLPLSAQAAPEIDTVPRELGPRLSRALVTPQSDVTTMSDAPDDTAAAA